MIPGEFIAALTFPGVILHEFAHKLFCDWFGIPVFKVKYFQFDNPAGYVLHEEPPIFYQALLIDVAPFIVCSLAAITLGAAWALTSPSGISFLFAWLGLSVGMNSFPSTGDANVLWQKAKQDTRKRNLLAILALPIVVLIYLSNILSIFWFDFWYGVAIAFVLPCSLFGIRL